ncbi:discoidin domain-containing protein [Streptomyces sp. N50]|uniref:discoidin domain-containing protein n=1 Tax=Streptomyces sp. N50 TaxID=3081765 RepID=UPI0029623D61|nr:discoidin domain-containing protein [Streptomyces sp. N50]WOX14207.1 discoidin domain-containing protein [Streptomyces sp. N50]
MGVTRRVFLRAAIATAAVGTVGATGTVLAPTASAAGAPGDVVGKITVGYQGWFACVGDGAPINGWWHWTQNWSQPPSPTNTGISCWPDVREYTNTYQTSYAALGNGQPAKLFSSYDQQTVNTHFLWMQQNSIDTAALQRFNPTGGEGPTRDAMATKVRGAAESYGRKFYIMYDVSNWTNMQSEIKTDWTNKMSAHTASSAYAKQNGKPVVCIWGFGFNDPNHPFTPDACLDVVNWFKGQGCYVIGGVPREWRTGTGGSQAGFSGVYHAFNMISPWMVGAIGNVTEADNAYTTYTVPDQADCNANGIDFQPCVLPGDVSGRQRAHGDFMWRQFYNMVRAGVQGIYISMFDEYNEGNQIAKTAETQAWVPTNSGFLALDEDGTACSSDYYLRLTGDGGRMLKGQLALTPTRPTQPVIPNGGDTTPPAAPGGLTATGHTSDSVSLSWNTATDNVGVSGYRVLRVSGSTSTQVGTTGSTSFTVTGLGASTAYAFDVVAYDAAGNVSQPSNQVTVTTDPPSSTTNLALHKATSESSHTQTYASGNATDGDTNTYWESANNAFPQWIQVDLGAATGVKRIVLKLPPATAWATRTQTISVQGGTDAGTSTQLLASAGYTFDPATGNTATLTLPSTVTTRYIRLTITANNGWPAGQVSEFQVFGA